jgi:DNA-binding transcriptional ArsR family regulator
MTHTTTPAQVDVIEVDDPEVLRMVIERTRLEILENCAVPRTVTELADLMEVPRTRLYHHIGLLADAGFLQVVEKREVGALTEKVYQTAGKSLRASPRLLASGDLRLQVEAIGAGIFGVTQADMARSLRQGQWSLSPDREKRTASFGRRLFRLSEQELIALIADLDELMEKYDHEEDANPDGIPVAAVIAVYPSARTLP